MSNAEAAEFSKLADTTYRDVNIALANEFARYADRIGVDILEVIAAANSQPYSHIHQPGLGVGGHCIPVYPHFLLSRAPEMELVELSRRVNDGQVGLAIKTIQKALGGLEGVPVLVLGLTYRDGVKELAYSRAMPLIERLAFHGAHVSAYDPLLSDAEVERWGATRITGATAARSRRSSPRPPTRSSGPSIPRRSRTSRWSSTVATACATWTCRRTSRTTAWACPDATAGPPGSARACATRREPRPHRTGVRGPADRGHRPPASRARVAVDGRIRLTRLPDRS